jgi:Mor family transcriptional regulator
MNSPQDLHGYKKAVEEARRHGIADEICIRNINIYAEYLALRAEFIKYEDAIEQLSQKYFLSGSRIEKIIREVRQSGKRYKATGT